MVLRKPISELLDEVATALDGCFPEQRTIQNAEVVRLVKELKERIAERDTAIREREALGLLRSLIPRLCEYCAGPINRHVFPLKQWGVPERNNIGFTHEGTHNLTPCGAESIHEFLLRAALAKEK